MGKPPPFFAGILILSLIVSATVGLGLVSVIFDDSLPADDGYASIFQAVISKFTHSSSTGLTGTLLGAAVIVLLASSLFATIANLTTGTTIPSSRFNNSTITFTPNLNVTSSFGFVPMIQLIPFLFGSLVLLVLYAMFERVLPGGF